MREVANGRVALRQQCVLLTVILLTTGHLRPMRAGEAAATRLCRTSAEYRGVKPSSPPLTQEDHRGSSDQAGQACCRKGEHPCVGHRRAAKPTEHDAEKPGPEKSAGKADSGIERHCRS